MTTIPYFKDILKGEATLPVELEKDYEVGVIRISTNSYPNHAALIRMRCGRWQISAICGKVWVTGRGILEIPGEETPNPYGRWKENEKWFFLEPEDVVRFGEDRDQIAFRV